MSRKTDFEARQYPGIFGRVHDYDYMLAIPSTQALDHYGQVGVEACNLLEEALSLVNRNITDVRLILDFGCGYGRVTRVLVQRIVPQKVDVFDVDPDAVTFCASEFGVNPLLLRSDWDSIPFDTYDLIWVGSVFTHLSEAYTRKMLFLFNRILATDGLLIFTTHGEDTLQRLQAGGYGERFQRIASKVTQEIETKGFSFIPYDFKELSLRLEARRKSGVENFSLLNSYTEEIKNYGKTWISKSYMVNLVESIFGSEIRLLKLKSNGWDNHQDVFIYHRAKT